MTQKSKHNYIWAIAFALLTAVLLTCALVGLGFAKYVQTDDSSMDLSIAARYNVSFNPGDGELIVPETVPEEWEKFTSDGALKILEIGSAYGSIPDAFRTGYNFEGWNERFIPVEYLETTQDGGQYIDSGVIGNERTAIDITFSAKDSREGNKVFSGAGNYDNNSFELYTYNISGQPQMWEVNHGSHAYKFSADYTVQCIGYGEGYTPVYRYFNNPESPAKYTIENLTDGKSVSNTLGGDPFTTPFTICFFGTHRAKAATGSVNPVRIYSVKMYQDGEIIRDFQPAVWVGSSETIYSKNGTESRGILPTGTAGFLDTLSNVFYINGSDKEAFVVGVPAGAEYFIENDELTSSGIFSNPEDIVFNACWTPKRFMLNFDGNKGSGSTDVIFEDGQADMEVVYDSKFGTFPNVKRNGYLLDGWEDSEGSVYTASDTVKLLEDTTLSAIWTPKEYRLLFDGNGADELEYSDTVVTFDGTYGQLPVATKEGFSFAGWTLSQSENAVDLPAGYSPLNYLEGSGEQYIDLGFIATEKTAVDISFSAKTNTNGVNVYGAGIAYNNHSYELYIWNGWEINRNSAYQTGVIPSAGWDSYGNPIYRCYSDPANPQSFTIYNTANPSGGNTKTVSLGGTNSFQTGTYTMYLFALNRPEYSATKDNVRIYECKFYEDGALIRNLVPAVWGGGNTRYSVNHVENEGDLASGTVGMFDLENGVFYINSGSGLFECGAPMISGFITEDTRVITYIDQKAYAQWIPLAAESE